MRHYTPALPTSHIYNGTVATGPPFPHLQRDSHPRPTFPTSTMGQSPQAHLVSFLLAVSLGELTEQQVNLQLEVGADRVATLIAVH